MNVLFSHFIALFLESAPWLLLGFTVAGFIKALIPPDWMLMHLGAGTPMSVVKSALIGAPLPLCSCGVIPAALGLRRAGASKSSTTAFLIATPETGVDSVSITYSFMGWFMALVRPIAAVVSAITAGLLVLQMDRGEKIKEAADSKQSAKHSSCCSLKEDKNQHMSCCAEKTNQNHSIKANASCCIEQEQEKTSRKESSQSVLAKIIEGLRFSLLDLSKDVALWLLIGFILAALIRTFVPVEFLTQWGEGWLAFLVMAMIGVPMYICATASTPIAAALLFSGVSPGAVLVFMLVGPATNIATVSLVKQELGIRPLVAYLSSIVLLSFLFGWLVNLLNHQYGQYELVHLQQTMQHESNASIAMVSGFVLSVLMIRGLWLKYIKL